MPAATPWRTAGQPCVEHRRELALPRSGVDDVGRVTGLGRQDQRRDDARSASTGEKSCTYAIGALMTVPERPVPLGHPPVHHGGPPACAPGGQPQRGQLPNGLTCPPVIRGAAADGRSGTASSTIHTDGSRMLVTQGWQRPRQTRQTRSPSTLALSTSDRPPGRWGLLHQPDGLHPDGDPAAAVDRAGGQCVESHPPSAVDIWSG
jgi:hypothetical protein